MTDRQIPNVRVWAQGREYVEAAEILLDYNRIQPAAVVAALAIEIFIKSFLATRNAKGHATTERGHGIVEMFERVEPEIKSVLLACSNEVDPAVEFLGQLRKHDRIFLSARYWYERTAPRSVGSDIVDFARHVCDSVFLLGQKRGV
jgi:HEPN domain-containing protein